MASRIEDYALIGDCETAALVARNGSIDWLCLPRFDSGACFAALLGTEEHGFWRLAPSDEIVSTRRRYREGTLILETDYDVEGGAVTVVDCMPLRTKQPDGGSAGHRPGAAGRRCGPRSLLRFDYGSIVPWVRRTDDGHSSRSLVRRPSASAATSSFTARTFGRWRIST